MIVRTTRVKVGHRQALHSKTPQILKVWGVLLCGGGDTRSAGALLSLLRLLSRHILASVEAFQAVLRAPIG